MPITPRRPPTRFRCDRRVTSAAVDRDRDAKRPGWRSRHRADAREFSHGRGLTPPGLEDAREVEGGRYHGRTPPVARDIRMGEGQMSRLLAPRRWPEN